ncbi:hypothetical protein N9L80_02820 [Luminiphilus sp.]|nr:hypothetical protein [Luminiphilus sp.]
MGAEWFLWGGLVISVVWHVASWLVWQMETGVTDFFGPSAVAMLNTGFSALCVCGFGYLLSI